MVHNIKENKMASSSDFENTDVRGQWNTTFEILETKIYIQPYMCVCVNSFIFGKATFRIKVAQEIYYQHKRNHEIFISIFWGT